VCVYFRARGEKYVDNVFLLSYLIRH